LAFVLSFWPIDSFELIECHAEVGVFAHHHLGWKVVG